MRVFFIVIALTILTSVLAETAFKKSSGVAILTADNFENVIAENKFVFVKFYAPWCGHCQKLAPKWAKLASLVDKFEYNVVIAKINAEKHQSISEEHEVSRFMIFRLRVIQL